MRRATVTCGDEGREVDVACWSVCFDANFPVFDDEHIMCRRVVDSVSVSGLMLMFANAVCVAVMFRTNSFARMTANGGCLMEWHRPCGFGYGVVGGLCERCLYVELKASFDFIRKQR